MTPTKRMSVSWGPMGHTQFGYPGYPPHMYQGPVSPYHMMASYANPMQQSQLGGGQKYRVNILVG